MVHEFEYLLLNLTLQPAATRKKNISKWTSKHYADFILFAPAVYKRSTFYLEKLWTF